MIPEEKYMCVLLSEITESKYNKKEYIYLFSWVLDGW